MIADDENSLAMENEKELMFTDPLTFEDLRMKTNGFTQFIANEIASRLGDLEPTQIFTGPDYFALGFTNPMPSKRIPGEKRKSIVRVVVHRLKSYED